jgi:hypothetical protein
MIAEFVEVFVVPEVVQSKTFAAWIVMMFV